MADEGIRRLQAELQEVYRSSAKQKLSERNVVELVTKLVELRMIDVLYTIDGKTYLTHQQLGKEIRDELIVHGGRIALVDLQQILNVNYSHIESKVNDMVKHETGLTLVLGQLIDSSYRQRLADEINDHLHENGHVTIMELAQSHNLPADFFREVIGANLGKRIIGQVDAYDKDIVFTDAFLARMKARIRGAFSAVTVPTTIGPIRQSNGCQEHLFHLILEDLISKGRLAGMLSGSRQDKSQFLPEIYTRAQNEWVDNFFRQNGYLEYDALSRLGIGDAKGYIKKRFKSESLVFLSSCCVGPSIFGSVEASIDDAVSTGGWVDIKALLPSVLSLKDASELVAQCLKDKPHTMVSDQTIVANEKLITDSLGPFQELMAQKAEKASKSNTNIFVQDLPAEGLPKTVSIAGMEDTSSGKDDRKEQRRKKAATAGSSKKEGTGGREVNMKAVKKKGRGGNRDAGEGSDDDHSAPAASKGKPQELPFMTVREIEEVLKKQAHLMDCPPELVSDIASKLHRPLMKEYQQVAKSIFMKTFSGADRKKSALEVQDQINEIWVNAHLFLRGMKHFADPVDGQLTKHLLKTICTDLAKIIIIAIANEYMVTSPDKDELSTAEMRLRLVSTLPRLAQEPLGRVLTTLNGTSMVDFFSAVESVCGPEHLGILLKKPDKRRDRQLTFNHRQCLAQQLQAETDPAMTLHLASVLLFQTFTQSMLHAPGRLVPSVLQVVTPQLEADKTEVLSRMEDLVVKHARFRSDPEVYSKEEVEEVANEMNQLLDKVKEIGLTTKKASTVANE